MGRELLERQGSRAQGQGTSTPSQTAWALIGLLAGEDEISDNVMRGGRWLRSVRMKTGAWEETEFTGTGFPNHFYLRYQMYAHYFPLMALGRFRRAIRRPRGQLKAVSNAMKIWRYSGSNRIGRGHHSRRGGPFPDRFRVAAMAAGSNLDLLEQQVRRFRPELVSVATAQLASD